MIEIHIARERKVAADVLQLLRASEELMARLYPAESNHIMDAAELEGSAVSLHVARSDGKAIGCGAWVRNGKHEAELKRMFVSPDCRGQRLGRRILLSLEEEAAEAGIRIMRLETGVAQPEAISLYLGTGYERCGPFGSYTADPLSLFMEKHLPGPAAGVDALASAGVQLPDEVDDMILRRGVERNLG